MDADYFKLKKSQIVMFVIICACLYYITESFFMTLGVMVLLILASYLISAWIGKKQGKEEEHFW